MAVAEPNAEGRAACQALAPRAKVFHGYTELLDAATLDAVVICLPPALHAEAAITGFSRRLHVYLEKPLATSLADAHRVVDAWRHAGTTGMMGFNYRFHPLVGALKQALAREDLGAVTMARGSFGAAPRALPAWKQARESGGGALLDLASHHIDLARFLFESEVVGVSAMRRSVHSEDDTAIATLRLSSGPLVSLTVSLAGVEEDRFEVSGASGQWVFDRYRSSSLRRTPARRDYRAPSRLAAAAGVLTAVPSMVRHALWPPREQTFALALTAFVACARGHRVAIPTLDDGLASLAVVIAAERQP